MGGAPEHIPPRLPLENHHQHTMAAVLRGPGRLLHRAKQERLFRYCFPAHCTAHSLHTDQHRTAHTCTHLSSASGALPAGPLVAAQEVEQVVTLARRSRRFFPPGSAAEIWQEVRPLLADPRQPDAYLVPPPPLNGPANCWSHILCLSLRVLWTFAGSRLAGTADADATGHAAGWRLECLAGRVDECLGFHRAQQLLGRAVAHPALPPGKARCSRCAGKR